MEFEKMLQKFSGLKQDTPSQAASKEKADFVTPRKNGVTNGKNPESDPALLEDNRPAVIDHPEARQAPGVDVHIRVEKDISVDLAELPASVIVQVTRRLTWPNPLWIRAKRAGTLTDRVTRTLTGSWILDGRLHINRGFAGPFLRILQAHRLRGVYEDHTNKPKGPGFLFKGRLYSYQQEAVDAARGKRFGTISGQTGSGKKVIALALAAERNTTVLVIVQTRAQAYQWLEMVNTFLGLSGTDCGIIGDGRLDIGFPFTVAISKSLHKVMDHVAGSIGFLIVDHCDHINLNIFFRQVRHIPSAYMLGLLSSKTRYDKLTEMVHAYLGPNVYDIDIARVYLESTTVHPVFVPVDTEFEYNYREDWKEMVSSMAVNPERNQRISTDILASTALNRDARAVVIVERLTHLAELQTLLQDGSRECAIVSGKTPKTQLPQIMEDFDKGKTQIICITSGSFDLLKVKKITHLYVVSPLRHPDILCQAVGKLMWARPGDDPPQIIDYQDKTIQLQGSYRGRMRVYRDMGVRLEGGNEPA